MSKPQPVQSSPKSERSTRIRTSDEGLEGEALAQCSDNEWEQSESAYSADLLNVKKKAVCHFHSARDSLLFRIG